MNDIVTPFMHPSVTYHHISLEEFYLVNTGISQKSLQFDLFIVYNIVCCTFAQLTYFIHKTPNKQYLQRARPAKGQNRPCKMPIIQQSFDELFSALKIA